MDYIFGLCHDEPQESIANLLSYSFKICFHINFFSILIPPQWSFSCRFSDKSFVCSIFPHLFHSCHIPPHSPWFVLHNNIFEDSTLSSLGTCFSYLLLWVPWEIRKMKIAFCYGGCPTPIDCSRSTQCRMHLGQCNVILAMGTYSLIQIAG